ncbi:hypothetical protein BDM02DRAFT_1229846 [Thelephora ganbajun]|uniref:Uncharacterized protein n=1 Tax=Thelephora ganbajun TaxID=370292 RepID=A0ACB6Z414_THEGA|nr:hypothetical protein BDM02DRAFT_1229846 [Thelephora ganbajun]
MDTIHHLINPPAVSPFPDWRDYSPSADELIPFSRALAQAAKFEYRRRRHHQDVPYWLVRFALRFLSQDQLPPTSVVADCLTIIAVALGCDVPDTNSMAPDENARLEHLFALIVREYETIDPGDLYRDRSKDGVAIAFLTYAARREEDGAVLPISLKYVTPDLVRYESWHLWHANNINAMMRLWMAAASAVPYTDDIGRSVVDALLVMAYDDKLSPHIPVAAWDWLKKRPILPAGCGGLEWGAHSDVVQIVRELWDVELIASYLFVVWSEWTNLWKNGCPLMMALIKEELCGIEAVGYQEDLIQRLRYALLRLDPGSFKERYYVEFRRALLKVDEETTKTLTSMSHRAIVLFAY